MANEFYPSAQQLVTTLGEDFLHDKSKNEFLPSQKVVYLSKIFKWYGGDFQNGGYLSYINAASKTNQEITRAKAGSIVFSLLERLQPKHEASESTFVRDLYTNQNIVQTILKTTAAASSYQ